MWWLCGFLILAKVYLNSKRNEIIQELGESENEITEKKNVIASWDHAKKWNAPANPSKFLENAIERTGAVIVSGILRRKTDRISGEIMCHVPSESFGDFIKIFEAPGRGIFLLKEFSLSEEKVAINFDWILKCPVQK